MLLINVNGLLLLLHDLLIVITPEQIKTKNLLVVNLVSGSLEETYALIVIILHRSNINRAMHIVVPESASHLSEHI